MQHEQGTQDDAVTGCRERSEPLWVPTESSPGIPALSLCRSSTCATSQTLSTLSNTSGGGRDSLEADTSDLAHQRGVGDGPGRLAQREGTTGGVPLFPTTRQFAPLAVLLGNRQAGLQALKLARFMNSTLPQYAV